MTSQWGLGLGLLVVAASFIWNANSTGEATNHSANLLLIVGAGIAGIGLIKYLAARAHARRAQEGSEEDRDR